MSGEDHKLDIAIEPHVLLVYPTAFYFYVNEQNSALATKIKEGLELLIANGQFDHIFNLYCGDLIEKIRSEDRQIFRLDNRFLPSNVPMERKELWL